MPKTTKPKNPQRAFRLSDERWQAAEDAAKNRRMRTGELYDVWDLFRDGLAVAVKAEGVAWPE